MRNDTDIQMKHLHRIRIGKVMGLVQFGKQYGFGTQIKEIKVF